MKKFRMAAFVSIVLTVSGFANGQYEIRESGTYLSEYRINGKKPTALKDVMGFILSAPAGEDPSELPMRANGDVPVNGYVLLVGGQQFPFDSAHLIKGQSGAFEGLAFVTKHVRGVRFRFEGRFLPRPKQEEPGGDYTEIRGAFTKFSAKKKIATIEVPLYVYALM